MPYVTTSAPDNTFAGASYSPSLQTMQQTANDMNPVGGVQNPFANAVGMGLMAVPDLADTLLTNKFAAPVTGLQKGDVNQAALNAIGQPGLTDFYNRNQAGIETISGIGGMVAADLIARKNIAPALASVGILRELPYAGRIARLDDEYQGALATVKAGDTALMSRGALGTELYSGEFTATGTRWDPASKAFTDQAITTTRSSAVFKAKALGAAVEVRNMALSEGVAFAALNSNGFLYDDNASWALTMNAAGLGVGALTGWLHGAYQIRKAVNSDGLKRALSSALDPDGIEVGRLKWADSTTEPLKTENSFLGGTYTDQVTSYMTNSWNMVNKPLEDSVDARALLSQRQRLALQHEGHAIDELQKVTVKGVPFTDSTRFSLDNPAYGRAAKQALKDDPAAFYGIESLGAVPDGQTASALHDIHAAGRDAESLKIADTLSAEDSDLSSKDLAALQLRQQRLNYMQKLTPTVMVDGQWMPLSEGDIFENFTEPKLQFTAAAPGQRGGLYVAMDDSGKTVGSIDTDFVIHGTDLTKADTYDVMRLYRVANRVIDHMSSWVDPIKLPANPNWLQLDMAEELLRRSQGNAKIIWPAGMTRDSAQVESFAQKAAAAKATMADLERAGTDPDAILSQLNMRFNLPKLTSYEAGLRGSLENPIHMVLRGAAEMDPEAIRAMNLTELKQSVAEAKRLGDMTDVGAKDVQSLYGSSFRFMLDDSGNPVKPILGYKRPMQMPEWSQDSLAERLAAKQLSTVQLLTDPETADDFTRTLSANLLADPDTQIAMQTSGLADTQIQGSLVGTAPQTFLGSLGNATRNADFMARDSKEVGAAIRIQDRIKRVANDMMRSIVEGTFGGAQDQLKNPRNAKSALLLDQFHSFRSGWDLNSKPIKRGDDLFAFELGDTEANRVRWRRQFRSDLPEGQTLMGPNNKEVVLDNLGLDLQTRFNQVMDQLLEAKNTILNAKSLPSIQRQNWYVPPQDIRGKYIGMVLDPMNRPMPGMTVVADTPEQFAKMRADVEARLQDDGLGLGYVFKEQQDIKNFADIYDRAQQDMISPGTTAIQPGKKATGTLTGQDIRRGSFDESMRYLRSGFEDHARDVIKTIFDPQIKANESRAELAAPMKKNNSKFSDIKYKSIYDIYNESLLGKSSIASNSSLVARVYNGTEGAINEFLATAAKVGGKPAAMTSAAWSSLNGWIDRKVPWSSSSLAKKDFESLSAALGPHMPFESAAEMIEKDGLGARPWTAAKIAKDISQFGAASVLRFFEVAQPIMNLSGIVNAMPAVVRSFGKMTGEDDAAWLDRIGHSALIFDMPDGKRVAVPDMVKMGSKAFKMAWSREAHPYYDAMVRRGYLSQEVAEFKRQFGSIESRADWQKFMMGDPTIKNPKGALDIVKSKGVVGWGSILSDKSEDFSRAWAQMIGIQLAEHIGLTGMDAQIDFAHDVANKMIANYSPLNRPEIYQGAIGTTLGLFHSYMQEFYQRMFRYVETKDMDALIHQYVMQGALFGINSVPGWAEYNQLMTHMDKNNDFSASVRHHLGPVADLMQHGTISNLPTLFGAPAVDLYSRGDTQIRLPGFSIPPGLAVMGKIGQGIVNGASAVANSHGILTGQQIAEIIGNSLPNRPIAGMIQTLAGGDTVDRFGQLMTSNKGAMEAGYRMIGLRSERQSNEINAYYANRGAMSHKASLDGELRLATRAAIREGNTDVLPNIYQQYVSNGGDPRMFTKWLRAQTQAATTTRGQHQLEQELKSTYKDPVKMGNITRLLDAGVQVSESPTSSDNPYVNGASGSALTGAMAGTLGQYPGQATIQPQVTSPP